MEFEPDFGALQPEVDRVIDNLLASYESPNPDLIGCDFCGIVAPSSEFAFGEDTPEFAEAVALKGYKMTNPIHVSAVQTRSAGLACKSCGNFSEFDMHPNTFPYPPEP